jgi:transcriptional regulator with XRE-family HTH domain
MTGLELKNARNHRKLTQVELAQRVGVSQTYVALLESGKRPFPSELNRKLVRLLNMSPAALPLTDDPFSVPADRLAEQLGALGYPGFSHLRASWKRHPAEVLLSSLVQENLESRVAEGLPWLMLRYVGDLDRQWLLDHARLRNLTNRLGFVVTLAKEVAAQSGDTTSDRYRSFTELEQQLRESRLDREDTLCQASLSQNEREWLRQVRPPYAAEWHLLTDWRPEHLPYAA